MTRSSSSPPTIRSGSNKSLPVPSSFMTPSPAVDLSQHDTNHQFWDNLPELQMPLKRRIDTVEGGEEAANDLPGVEEPANTKEDELFVVVVVGTVLTSVPASDVHTSAPTAAGAGWLLSAAAPGTWFKADCWP
ncbi:Hypothetical predicted protein [Mytilus galloprovincialis]|uniref:Uncharacterized protein n=1 Tax=Mytilus galloprovincialis TaxID=29158 RepID=A0A8B6C4K3_MYTGA|nr:Hypothetical predicted protein [Mytilus galloprovincialis]